ncbi:MAG: hypothetical protein CM1200mP27_03510 [Chloroflexota bacterium]|nr:MAG: hypothetical protein CM1200mP27_03510 [Chloroflexota bacterium]
MENRLFCPPFCFISVTSHPSRMVTPARSHSVINREQSPGRNRCKRVAPTSSLIGDAVLFHQVDEVLRRVPGHGGDAEEGIFRLIVFGKAHRLVKLHRPPPDIKIFLPTRSACPKG